MPIDVMPALDESRMDSRVARLPVTINLSCDSKASLSNTSRFRGKRVHFIGIGGCGMSGLAGILLDAGAIVSGSEPHPNPQTFALTQNGARISRDQLGELLDSKIDLVVRTAAVRDDNPEYLASRRQNLKSIKYAQLLGEVMSERFGVAVAGTHGKSTTTAMISHAMVACGADPSFVVGGTVPQLGGGSRSGMGPVFVAEACEFDRSFHHLRPRVAIITNIEEDHLDCYKDIDDIIGSFRQFARIVPESGLIIANGEDAHVRRALDGITTPIERVGDADGWEVWPAGMHGGCHVGHVRFMGRPACALRLSVPGLHNLMNATMAIAACRACGLEPQQAADAIGNFTGVDRRMSEIGHFNGATVVDDYGHHPTEIRVTLKALRERYQPKRLLCVFQPHQHSRTRFLLEDFASSFGEADETIVPDIYFVRDSESERQRVSSVDLVDRLVRSGNKARHIPQFAEIVAQLKHEARVGDLIVTMGAGNVWEIGRDLISETKE
jgi:UDP-N-acetylmuramate--alanine ligase